MKNDFFFFSSKFREYLIIFSSFCVVLIDTFREDHGETEKKPSGTKRNNRLVETDC